MPRVALTTLGCKLNYVETSAVGKQFLDRGFDIVAFGEPTDVCVINTCSVTGRADRECRQLIRRALRTSGNPLVVVTGCYAQLAPQEVASIRGVDLVLGTREKFEIFDFLGGVEKKLYPHVAVSPIESFETFGPAFSSSASERTRAYLKIQDGCDYNCSFCTIPLARGSSHSQGLEACIDQAHTLVAQGYKEIVLTGVNVGDYGTRSGSNLLTLLRAFVHVDGLARIRISSIEPNLLTDELIAFVAESEVMCNHFHIPLQSGSDAILRLMRRRYQVGHYAALIDRITRVIPDCGIGVDVIAGFPGETDERFQETYRFLSDVPFSYLHVFTYSQRPNTPAATFAAQVEPKIRFKRNEMLRALGREKKHVFYSRMIGKTEAVLVEGHADATIRYGFTGNYVKVGIPVSSAAENTILPVTLNGLQHGVCVGQPVCEAATI
jgi:threonylcarbamoyladenosine tRNA methylthiotransferase MtaB